MMRVLTLTLILASLLLSVLAKEKPFGEFSVMKIKQLRLFIAFCTVYS